LARYFAVLNAAKTFNLTEVDWVFTDKDGTISGELQAQQALRAKLRAQLVYYKAIKALATPCGGMKESLTTLEARVKEGEQAIDSAGMILACATAMEIFVNQGSYENFQAVADSVLKKIQDHPPMHLNLQTSSPDGFARNMSGRMGGRRTRN
jgi:hypothetical protein